MKSKMNNSKLMVLTILTGLVVLGCKPDYQEQLAAVNTERTTKVRLQKLSATNAPIPVTASGVLASKAQALLSFKIGGVVEKLMVEEGQSFRKGQVLARLELTEINARVNQADENVNKLTRDRDRVQRLYADTVATLEQLQDVSTGLEVAESELEIARYNLRYASVVAREDGKVLRRLTERGELINPGAPVFQIAYKGKRSSHIVKLGVADRDVVKMQTGDSAHVSFDAYPGKAFQAFVSEIAEAADPRTGAFEIELTLSDSPYRLRDGFIAKLEIYPSLQEAYYKVPMSALVEGDAELATIYVPDNKTVKKMTVHPTYITDEFFMISEEEAKDLSMVVVQGTAYAKPGMEVEVLND
ncbi:MAG: efflux RND transporter periplasmic adaptor subunit [Roseivirga sp.]